MAEVINRSQQVVTAGLSPKVSYSRVVSVNLEVPDDGAWHWAVTPTLGQRFWLLEVQIWAFPKPIAAKSTAFEFKAGTVRPQPGMDIADWQNILPIYVNGGALPAWSLNDGIDYMSWTMDKLFANEARRLGVRAMRSVGFGADGLYVSFKISEG